MKKKVATLITLTCQWEARNLRSSKSQLYTVVNRTFTLMYNYCKSLVNYFTWRYANIFCATCNGELAAVQRQTIKIGKQTILFCVSDLIACKGCTNEHLLRSCGFDLRQDILQPLFYVPGELRWVRWDDLPFQNFRHMFFFQAHVFLGTCFFQAHVFLGTCFFRHKFFFSGMCGPTTRRTAPTNTISSPAPSGRWTNHSKNILAKSPGGSKGCRAMQSTLGRYLPGGSSINCGLWSLYTTCCIER